jgi:large-conductance mechanosensitive channel
MPENVNFGTPNVNPTNFFLEAEMEQQKTDQNSSQNQTQSSESKQNFKEKYNLNKENLLSFLNLKTTNILTFATAVAIGLTFKDLINSFVFNIFQPILMNIILALDKNNYLSITSIIREKNPQIDIGKLLGSILVVKFVVVLMYFINKHSHLFF